MQYQSTLNREQLVDLAIKRYFASVDRKDMAAVLNCFHENAMLTVQTAFATHVGHVGLRRMFTDFFGAFKTIIHRDFTCTVDADNGRIVASFVAELVDHNGQKTLLENTNFWRIRGDRFQEVYVYMSGANPLV